VNEGLVLLAGGVLLAIATAFSVTFAYRSVAVRSGLLDRPVERSSHSVPTPTGGGLGIVAGCGLAVAVFAIGA
jgi:UDP-GlcNAc:undecaprenyl-phosphate GlcNAc-1-phosphate transferase